MSGTVRIPVYGPNGLERQVIVDADVAELVKRYRWNARDDYAVSRERADKNGKRSLVTMHRLILGLANGDPRETHHRNGNRLDNRRANLIICQTTAEHRRLDALTARFRRALEAVR